MRYPESPAAKQREIEAREGRRIYYSFHRDFPQYVKVRLDVRDADGSLHQRFLTVADSRTTSLTYQQLLDRVNEILSKHGGYGGWTLESITYISEEIYTDRTSRPLRHQRFNLQTREYEEV